MKNEWKILIWLFIAVVLLRPVEMQCNPSFLLPNIIKDIVYLQYSSTGEEQFYPYIFFSAMISGNPIVAYAINQQSIEQTNSSLKFYLDIEMMQTQIDFYYNAPNFKWSITSVNFWISSRNDLIISKTVLQNIGQGQNQSRVFSITSNAQIDAQSTHIVFIVGIYSTYTQNLTISVTPGAVTATNASVSVSCGSNVYLTNISLISIIYNPTAAQFLSSSGSLNYKNFKGQYFNLYTKFLPIYYSLIGFSSFSITGSNLAAFNFKLQIVNSSLLNSSAKNQFDSLTLNYLTIGISMSKICDPCQNFFTQGACSDTCPANTYSVTYQEGGKACLTCNSLVGQMLNDLKNGCSCMPGYELISTNQCTSSGTGTGGATCTGVNQVLNGLVCACSSGTFNISGTCGTCPAGQIYQNGACSTPTCPPNASYNPSSRICLCDFGFMNISNSCKSCQQGQTFDVNTLLCKCVGLNQAINSLGKCQCTAGFFNISGTCRSCPDGTTFNGQSCITSKITCSQNQVISNNICVCDSFSVPLGATCIKCSGGTYASRSSNKCQNCLPNCTSCQNITSCTQCATGFIFNNTVKSCQNPNIVKKIIMKTGFPVYLSEGIISDFIVNSTKLNKKSSSELKSMINTQFSDISALPGRVFISQNPNDTNTLRIGFYYRGLFPLQPFSVIYSFQEISAGISQQQSVNYQYTSSNLKGNIPK